MKADGRCHCGNIRFEAEIDPEAVGICHWADCQTLTGSAFRVIVQTYEDGFRLLCGDLKTYIKTGDSGRQRTQTFCPECGTPIYSGPVGDGAKVYSIRVGALRQRNELIPRLQMWHRSAQPWIGSLGGVPSMDGQPAPVVPKQT
jgi:hypothetical protein